jgi:hypothetical protein
VKYYHIKVVPNEKGTSYSIKGKWEVVGGGGRWWEVVEGGSGRWWHFCSCVSSSYQALTF